MRRLPVFFLIDVSESMVGIPIENVSNGINIISTNLKRNPLALETAYISIIAFAGKPKLIEPLTDLISFRPPVLPIGGGTNLGDAMNFLMDQINANVQKTTPDKKGDWKPLVFLLTDGVPTDNCELAINRWNKDFKNKVSLVSVSIGNSVDTKILKQFTDKILIFDQTDPKAYAEFFKWVSSSIETKSKELISVDNDLNFNNINNNFFKKSSEDKVYDERYAILLSRCKKAGKLYLMKYLKESKNKYKPEGAYTVSEEYFELSSSNSSFSINVDYLDGIIPCPSCNAQSFCYCICGKIFCYSLENKCICPWCKQEIMPVTQQGFSVTRTEG